MVSSGKSFVKDELQRIARLERSLCAGRTEGTWLLGWMNGGGNGIATTGVPAGICLHLDRMVIDADRRDVSIVRVSIIDEKGRIVPAARKEVTFRMEGPGKIIGVDNGDPSSHEADKPTRMDLTWSFLSGVQPRREVGGGRLPEDQAEMLFSRAAFREIEIESFPPG